MFDFSILNTGSRCCQLSIAEVAPLLISARVPHIGPQPAAARGAVRQPVICIRSISSASIRSNIIISINTRININIRIRMYINTSIRIRIDIRINIGSNMNIINYMHIRIIHKPNMFRIRIIDAFVDMIINFTAGIHIHANTLMHIAVNVHIIYLFVLIPIVVLASI